MIETERLILRPWKIEDAEELYQLAKDERVGPIAGWSVHKSISESEETIKTVLSDPETYAVFLKEQAQVIGSIGLMKPKSPFIKENEMELGYWIGVPFWKKGYAAEAAKAIIDYGFTELNLNAVWAGYYDNNLKSKRVQEKCGFLYQLTQEVAVKLLHENRIEHFNKLSRANWLKQR